MGIIDSIKNSTIGQKTESLYDKFKNNKYFTPVMTGLGALGLGTIGYHIGDAAADHINDYNIEKLHDLNHELNINLDKHSILNSLAQGKDVINADPYDQQVFWKSQLDYWQNAMNKINHIYDSDKILLDLENKLKNNPNDESLKEAIQERKEELQKQIEYVKTKFANKIYDSELFKKAPDKVKDFIRNNDLNHTTWFNFGFGQGDENQIIRTFDKDIDSIKDKYQDLNSVSDPKSYSNQHYLSLSKNKILSKINDLQNEVKDKKEDVNDADFIKGVGVTTGAIAGAAGGGYLGYHHSKLEQEKNKQNQELNLNNQYPNLQYFDPAR